MLPCGSLGPWARRPPPLWRLVTVPQLVWEAGAEGFSRPASRPPSAPRGLADAIGTAKDDECSVAARPAARRWPQVSECRVARTSCSSQMQPLLPVFPPRSWAPYLVAPSEEPGYVKSSAAFGAPGPRRTGPSGSKPDRPKRGSRRVGARAPSLRSAPRRLPGLVQRRFPRGFARSLRPPHPTQAATHRQRKRPFKSRGRQHLGRASLLSPASGVRTFYVLVRLLGKGSCKAFSPLNERAICERSCNVRSDKGQIMWERTVPCSQNCTNSSLMTIACFYRLN